MKTARFFIVLFFILAFLNTSRRAFVSFLGFDPRYFFGLLSIPTMVLATWKYRQALGPPPGVSGYRVNLAIFALLVPLLAFYGYLRGNLLQYTLLDLAVYILIFCFLYLGRYDQVWADLEKPLCLLMLAGILLIVAGTFRPAVRIGYEGIELAEIGRGRYTVFTLGYDLKMLLGLAPLIFAMGYMRPRWDWVKITGVVGIVAAITMQVYFQKRAPTLRELAYAGMVVLIIPMFHKKVKMGTTALLVVGTIVVVALAGGQHVEKLLTRYGEGAPLLENERWFEAGALLKDFNPLDYMVGRGMGGYFTPPVNWQAGVVFVNYQGDMGRPSLHVGMLFPLLKGGLIFMAVYYAFFFRLFVPKGRAWYLNRYNAAAMAVLPVYWFFQLIGGPPSIYASYDCVLIGLCCARFAVPVERTYPGYESRAIEGAPTGYYTGHTGYGPR